MPVTSVTTDPEALTLTVEAELPAGVDRVWEAYTDPRKLERFWGPPGYPATFERFDLTPGGIASYAMQSPEGQKYRGLWEFVAIEGPHRLVVIDRFADDDGEPLADMPAVHMEVRLAPAGDGTRMTTVSTFASVEDLEKTVEMGVVEGTRQSLAQLDIVLADLRGMWLGKDLDLEVLDDCHVRIRRVFDAPRELLWRAHTDPELMKRWLLGPDGWELTVTDNDFVEGGSYRTAWAPLPGTPGEAFGFEGENLVIQPQRRIVTTERMTGLDAPGTVNDLSFDEDGGVTLLTLLITYVDAAQRDMILGTGMTHGMEASYRRLEREVLAA